MKKNLLVVIVLMIFSVAFLSLLLTSCNKANDITPSEDKVQLGKLIFFDKDLSNPVGQSCASCHSPETGFSDPAHRIISEGAISGIFNIRNCQNIPYSMYSPQLHYDNVDSTYIGGFFYDGRVNTLAQQALVPFLGKFEMNNTNASMVVTKLRKADYFPIYRQLYGEITNDQVAFENIGQAVQEYESSSEVNPFTSKYDYYLKGQLKLTDQEMRGLQLFSDENKGKCANCHPTDVDQASGKVLFTDFSYDNIGVPKNPDNPFYTISPSFNSLGSSAIDLGLGGFLNDPDNYGKFRVPTLRNAAVSAPYFHNGYFKTLDDVVHFYNKRDVEPLPPAEIPGTVNHDELGDLNLTLQEEKDIVAFINTLTDGYKK